MVPLVQAPGRLLFHSIRLQSFHSTRLAMNILFYMTLWPASVLLVWFWMYHSTWLAYSTCLTVLVVFYLINHDRSTLLHIIIIVLFRHSSCHNYKIIIISDYRILFIFFFTFFNERGEKYRRIRVMSLDSRDCGLV